MRGSRSPSDAAVASICWWSPSLASSAASGGGSFHGGRMTKLVAAACVAVALLAAPLAFPQEQDHRHDGGALGEVNFPVSCNAKAQSHFNTAAALLYSFYWEKVDSAVA